MRYTLPKVVTTVAIVALLASGCGGSDDSEGADFDAVRAQVAEICADRVETYADRGAFPVEDFDPENPDPADLPAVGEYFASGLEGSEPTVVVELEGLSVTGAQREQVDALISAWKAEYASVRTQVDAAVSRDVEGFVASLDGAVASKEAVGDAARALGVTDCGQD